MSASSTSSRGSGEAAGDEYRYERAPGERPSEAVVAAVADAAGRPVVPRGGADSEDGADALSPLYEQLDPDALDALVASDDRTTDCTVTFTYGDYTVTVRERSVTVIPDA